jgi:hypothetical protein
MTFGFYGRMVESFSAEGGVTAQKVGARMHCSYTRPRSDRRQLLLIALLTNTLSRMS